MYTKDRERKLRLLGWLIHGCGALGIVVAGLAYHFVAVRLITQQRESNESEIAGLEMRLSSAEATRQDHRRLSDELAGLERDAETMRQRIPDQSREAEFLLQVNEAARLEDLTIVNYERSPVVSRRTHSEFQIRLVCEGNYASICAFFDRLANLPRVTTVQKMNVTASDRSSRYPLDITLLLYYGARNAPGKG
jgi:Tfp pilus assembly protein PilO